MTDWPRQPDSRTCGPSVVVVARLLDHGLPEPWPGFRDEVLAMHRRLNRWWPRALGTTPWAVARVLGGRVRRYRRADVLAALPRRVPVYLGSRWLPRHVVLVLDERDGEPLAYDPARGVVAPLSTSRWRHAWFAVLPD
ncbi:hypothetical protein KM427_19630 [Nocardioides sp. LMS-CY]|uniref:hypothetical protein n=1 Tax=Nocardioides sp. (strain LMS-CY) TaxID=2840457 RepID=UPI001C003E11|nr:hypothetical protein [Nocardioides sp. LMS-CY]QWF21135.1 hypothetical protein KM427_19630 [Nocardioides sp. LMS-CY]